MGAAKNSRGWRHCCVALVVFAGCLTVGGCRTGAGDRPDLGEVTGVVTLDGAPLPDASVSFTQPGFRSSVGKTDSQGRYELIYIRDVKGAAVGTHVVKIKLFKQNGGQADQLLPSRYNSKSELSREVKPGPNVFNFDLKSSP